jgi:hypothetical protein
VQQSYRTSLAAVRAGSLKLANTDFDTGKRAQYGEYPLADKTYAELLERLCDRDTAGVSASLRTEINRFYRQAELTAARTDKDRKRLVKVQAELADLNGRVSRAR